MLCTMCVKGIADEYGALGTLTFSLEIPSSDLICLGWRLMTEKGEEGGITRVFTGTEVS